MSSEITLKYIKKVFTCEDCCALHDEDRDDGRPEIFGFFCTVHQKYLQNTIPCKNIKLWDGSDIEGLNYGGNTNEDHQKFKEEAIKHIAELMSIIGDKLPDSELNKLGHIFNFVQEHKKG